MDKIVNFANYCASCVTKPCQIGCPLNNDITGFINLVKQSKFKEAYDLLSETTALPSICGRICPHNRQCQGMCVKGVSYQPVQIGILEAHIGDLALQNNWSIKIPDNIHKNKKVAIVGSGPAGLTCAAFLRKQGYQVTIYEKHNYLGGLLYHGIPDFRLPKDLLKQAIDKILELGIKIHLNSCLGDDFTLDDLKNKYDAIFLGFGANISRKMNIPNENLNGVYGGNELLENQNHPDYRDKIVVVSGGGNVAMDVSRTVKRLGAKKVYVVYRRSQQEAPAEPKEIKEAKEEGVEFLFQNNILKIEGSKHVEKVELIKTKLEKQKNDNRLSPVNIQGSNYYLSCDYVIMAIGSIPENKIVNSLGLELDHQSHIKIDQLGHTSCEKVFAGGDVAGSKGTVAFAARAGRNAANAIIKYLES